jgi:predicted nucleic-acid-binding Zn-ribbon protein
MKSSGQCPKCESKQVVLLGGVTFNSKVYPFGLDDTGYSTVARYACTDCGYVEEYLVDPKELSDLKKTIGR